MANEEPATDESGQSEGGYFPDVLAQALNHLRDGQLENAAEAFALAASLERQLPAAESARLGETLERRVALYEAWGRALTALQRTEQARWQNKKAIDSLLIWTDLLLDAGDHDGALRCVDFAFEVGSRGGAFSEETLFSARWLRGNALLVAERYEQALDELRTTSELASETGTEQQTGAVYLLIGVAENGLKQYDEAVGSFRRAGQANVALAVFARNAAFSVLRLRGRYQEAWAELGDVETHERSRSTQLEATAQAAELYQLGIARSWRGDFDEAQAHFEESKRLGGGNILLWATLIDFYLERREHDLEDSNRWYWRARDAYERAKADLEQRTEGSPDASTLLKLGVLATAVEDDEAAESCFQNVIDLGGDTRSAEANLGLICLRRGDARKASARFDAAVRSDPDDLRMRGLLGDAYARLKLFDRAEAEYRRIISSAPGTVEARIGLGEVAIAHADSGDTDLYLEAIREFDHALELDKGMTGPLEMREASMRLSRRQRAAVLYARGYAHAKLFEERGTWRALGLTNAARLLSSARRDFEAAVRENPAHFTAARAIDKLGRPAREIPKRALEGAAPIVVVALCLAILIYVQVMFIAGSDRISATQYVVLTFGLLMFLVAAFYLPAISKLKVGGAELQKSVTEQVSVPFALGLTRTETAITNVRAFFVDWDQGPGPVASAQKPSAHEAFMQWRDRKPQRVGVVDAEAAAGGE